LRAKKYVTKRGLIKGRGIGWRMEKNGRYKIMGHKYSFECLGVCLRWKKCVEKNKICWASFCFGSTIYNFTKKTYISWGCTTIEKKGE